MIVFSLAFISAAIVLYNLGFGDASLVYANIINLIARIIFAIVFARKFFVGKGSKISFLRVIPSYTLLISSLAIWGTLSYDGRLRSVERIVALEGRGSLLNAEVMQHVGLGITLAVVWLSQWWMSSGRQLNLRPRPAKE